MPPAGAFFAAIVSGVTSAISSAAAAFGSWASITAFLTSPFGSLILGVGLQLVGMLFTPKRQQAPSAEAGKVNVRVGEPERWIAAGVNRCGGGALFAEFDALGNFYYLIVHSDSILTGTVKLMFDDVEIQVDGAGNVITDDFCLDDKMNSYSGTGTKVPYFSVYTTTYTNANPVPPPISVLTAAFPTKWTSEHKLAGTTYSVIKVRNIDGNNRHKIFKWRGPIGIGEPAFSIVGRWSTAYDPNDNTQVLGIPGSYKFTRNPVLIWAWFRTHKYGRNKDVSEINWDKVREQSLICNNVVNGLEGSHLLYQCDIQIPESKERNVGEQEILMSMNAQLVFDNDGKCWPRVGYYYTPTLRLSRIRDIAAMESVEAQNGESETQGVIVRYIEPEANYSVQPSAAWINPLYYVPGETPKFLTVDVFAVQDHNQAMRLAKSIGMRSQSAYKLLPTVGLRGLKARQERIISLNYDNIFSGDHEIVTQVEVDANGIFCGFGCVPVEPNSFRLLSGEEKPKPVFADASSVSTPALPTGVIVTYRNGRFEAVFDPSPRADVRYIFQYVKTDEIANDLWSDFTVSMIENFAYSGTVAQNETYSWRVRAVTTGGRSTAYTTPVPISSSALVLTGTPTTTGTAGVPYVSWSLGVTGGTNPYIFSDIYGRLPVGIAINSSTGLVSGTPTTPGTYSNIVLRVQDAVGNSINRPDFTITIS